MKYVLLFAHTRDQRDEWERMPEADTKQAYAMIERWFEENGSKVTGGAELQPVTTATTVRFQADGKSVVTDGPFIEGNEVIGGFVEIEVSDLDEALQLAKTWPARGMVEVRPVVAR